MRKYLNIILLSFFGILSIELRFGYAFYIPFVFYYCIKNIKNMILIVLFSLLSTVTFKLGNMYLLLAIYLSIIIYKILIKNGSKILQVIYLFVINIASYYLYLKINNINNPYVVDIIVVISAIFIFIYIQFINEVKKTNIKNNIYNDLLLYVIISLSTINHSFLNISISLILSIYFVIYLSSNKQYIISFLFSIGMLYILKNIDYAIIIPVISFIYYIPSIISSIILISSLIFVYYNYSFILDKNLFFIIGGIAIVFEMIRSFVIIKDETNEIIENIYERTIKNVDKELNMFSLLLDRIVHDFNTGECDAGIEKIINSLVSSVCITCNNKNKCFTNNKGKLYYYFKSIIYGKEIEFDCNKKEEMKRYVKTINSNILNQNQYVSNIMTPLLQTVSNIVKQYSVDHSTKTEMNYNLFINLEFNLEKYGYELCLFDVCDSFIDSFVIEVGFIDIDYKIEKANIEKISSISLNCKTSVKIKEKKRNRLYITITKKINYEICYGYGSISKIGNSICGDNFLIKELNGNRFVAAICDGMGKGLKASIQSSRLVKLLDESIDTHVSSETSIQILNSLLYIQEYQDKYSTLDFVQIDRNNGEMLLYKAGATYTYILRDNNEVLKIENENLPFGLNEIVTTKKYSLKNNDLIIMASDGIFDNIINIKEFEKMIDKIKESDPQKIAYEILNYARYSEIVNKDDMSVITLKIKNV